MARACFAERRDRRGARMREVYHRRPCWSNIGLWTVVWLSQMASSPQNGDGCSGLGWPGVSGSRYGSLHLADGVVHRIEHRADSRGFPRAIRRSGRWRSRVGLRLSVEISSCRYAFGSAQSHCVITTLRSMPCGRGGACAGSSPCAMRWSNRRTPRWRAAGPVESRPPIIALPACPDCTRRSHAWAGESKLANIGGMRARVFVAELVAGFAAIGLDQVDPLALVLDVRRDAVARTGPCREIRSSSGTFSSAYQ